MRDIKPPFTSIEDYLAFKGITNSAKNKEKLLQDANMAIGWGRPDRESTGYSHGELISLISRLANYIKQH